MTRAALLDAYIYIAQRKPSWWRFRKRAQWRRWMQYLSAVIERN
jgi:hypothetical protein